VLIIEGGASSNAALLPYCSLGFKDALSDHVVAEFVDGNNEIIVVSCKQVEVNSEVEVAHVHHVLKILDI